MPKLTLRCRTSEFLERMEREGKLEIIPGKELEGFHRNLSEGAERARQESVQEQRRSRRHFKRYFRRY